MSSPSKPDLLAAAVIERRRAVEELEIARRRIDELEKAVEGWKQYATDMETMLKMWQFRQSRIAPAPAPGLAEIKGHVSKEGEAK